MSESSKDPHNASSSGVVRSLNFLLLLSAILGMVFCVILVKRNKELAAKFSQMEMPNITGDEIKDGDLVAGFHGSDLEGRPLKLAFDEHPGMTMLLVISPSCSACDDEVMEWWPQLATDPRFESLNPTMVALSDAAELLTKFPEEFLVGRIFTSPPRSLRRAYRMKAIPTVLLVSPQGEVFWHSSGGLDEGAFQQLLKAGEKPVSLPKESADHSELGHTHSKASMDE